MRGAYYSEVSWPGRFLADLISIPAIGRIVVQRRTKTTTELDNLTPEVEDGVASLYDQLIEPLSRWIERDVKCRASKIEGILALQSKLKDELSRSISEFTTSTTPSPTNHDGSSNVHASTETKIARKLLE